MAVLALFLYAMALEGHRKALSVLDKEGKGHVAWGDVKAYAAGLAPAGCLPVQLPCLSGVAPAQQRAAKQLGLAEA